MVKKQKSVVDITQEKTLCETKFLELKEVDYVDDGKSGKWSYVSRKNNNGIVAIIARKNYKFLFIMQKRVPVNKYVISFPSGLIDEGESPQQAAKRELKEETGYRIRHIISTSPFLPKSAGLTDESVYIVRCNVHEQQGWITDPAEGTRPFWMSAGKFIDYVHTLDPDIYAVENIAWSFIIGYARRHN